MESYLIDFLSIGKNSNILLKTFASVAIQLVLPLAAQLIRVGPEGTFLGTHYLEIKIEEEGEKKKILASNCPIDHQVCALPLQRVLKAHLD